MQQLLQIATVITKCHVNYKLQQYNDRWSGYIVDRIITDEIIYVVGIVNSCDS